MLLGACQEFYTCTITAGLLSFPLLSGFILEPHVSFWNQFLILHLGVGIIGCLIPKFNYETASGYCVLVTY
jgi:hypothetical protein